MAVSVRGMTGARVSLGPGLMYAALAIGVSHLVQSTRAGALYGLGMTAVLVTVGLVKYPAMRFGSQYASATGRSLPERYLEMGRWAAGLYLGSQLLGIWFGLAAVGVTTAGLVIALFGLSIDPVPLTGALIAGTAVLVTAGRYRWVEHVSSALVVLLVVALIAATAVAAPRVDWDIGHIAALPLDAATLTFVVAVAGWLPTPVEGSVLSSVWTVARNQDGRAPLSHAAALRDFNVGYVTAMVLAFGFLVLGVAIMYTDGVVPAPTAGGFSVQVITLFTETIGGWSYCLIGVLAVAALYSSLLAILDGMPRQFVFVARHLLRRAPPTWLHGGFVVVYAAGGYLLLLTTLTTFVRFIDMATTLGFLMAPIYAFLNHRAVTGPDVPPMLQPGRAMRMWSLVAFWVLLGSSAAYLCLRWMA